MIFFAFVFLLFADLLRDAQMGKKAGPILHYSDPA